MQALHICREIIAHANVAHRFATVIVVYINTNFMLVVIS